METFFRLHPRDEDPERLLDPERQVTEPWEGSVYGRCDKCDGSGETLHECESCGTGGRDPNCPSCGGELRYRAECPACEGSGEVDDSERDGVSVFPEEDGLYRYMLRRGAELAGAKLVELEGRESDDQDFDADEGALLVHPERIVDVRQVDSERIERLREQGKP
jgi:hypothetical protein